jgi:hypothetical protein
MENCAIKWFRRFMWIGILLNLGFCIPAFVAPRWLLGNFGMAYYNEQWLQNCAMLIMSLGVFYAAVAVDPLKNRTFAWLAVLSRLIALLFWLWIGRQSPGGSLRHMFILDGTMFVLLGVTLQLGLSAGEKLTFASVLQALWALNPRTALRRMFSTTRAQLVGAACAAFLALGGYALWDNLLRERPLENYASDEEQYKYGVIGLGVTARVPFYLFEVLPELFPEKFPLTGTYADLGLLMEPGMDIPVGFAKRQVGFLSVEPNCALCHTGAYREAKDGKLFVIPGAPAHMFDLQRFQWMLYDCAGDARFTTDNVMKAIERRHKLDPIESLTYRLIILPMAKNALIQQGKQYAWQKSRPQQGRGRTDTFNPTKFNVMHFPWDQTIGTVDLPQVWNQKPREKLHLHWDGNNNNIRERNYAAAMAVGATPESVHPENFKRVTDYLLTLPAAKYPFSIDSTASARGKVLYDKHCASCHEFGASKTGTVTPLEEIGTDPHRLFSFTEQLVAMFHTFKTPPFDFGSYSKTYGYANTPLDGIWARAPYLHNGSVPTLWDLLQIPEKRPAQFFKGYEVYDQTNGGFVTSGPEAEKVGFLLKTSITGNGNQGHLYGTGLTDAEKRDLLEFLKTL